MSIRPTMTLAELYVRQGLIGRARDIYRELAEGDDAAAAALARRKLHELPSAGARIEALKLVLERVRQRRSSHPGKE